MDGLPKDRAPLAVPPITAASLAKLLRESTPAILAALSGEPPGGTPRWRFESRDEITKEWNGGEVGPSTHAVWTFEAGAASAEATVRLDTIRWSPDEVYRMEVSGHWRTAGRGVSLFARGEGLAAITEIRADEQVMRAVWG
ncbi:MAG: hypothetical protein AB7I79_20165 [Rhizobiaceae bacterium]